MADKTHIEWTDATWNPITGCTLVSEGCRNCYAARLAATRLKHHPSREGLARLNADGVAKFTGEVRFNEDWLDQPLRWKKPRRIFVCAHGDLFHENVPDEWIDRVFAVMALCPQHVFQVLTKRPDRMRDYFDYYEFRRPKIFDAVHDLSDDLARAAGTYKARPSATLLEPFLASKDHFPNVWLGVSVEDQATADARIPALLDTPAAIRFLSAEPLLGHMDLSGLPFGALNVNALTGAVDDMTRPCPPGAKLDWVIVGGESGQGARPMHPDWVRSLRDQCDAANVPFFFKQWGAWLPWEFGPAPAMHAQNGDSADANTLFPIDIDEDPNWDTGLGYINEDHVAFQRAGKAQTARYLDGVEHNEMPEPSAREAASHREAGDNRNEPSAREAASHREAGDR